MPDIKKFSKYITRIDLNINFKALLKIFFSFFFKKNYKIKFQKELSKYIGSKNIFLTGSGRAALFLILNQISKKTKKKQILVTPFTLTEVINVIKYAGFEPRFIDLDIKSGLPKFPSKHEIKKSCAILVTHLFTSDQKFIFFKNTLHKKLFIIEDAALNLGAKNNNLFLGTLSDYGFFSFGAAKNLCLINGGAAFFKNNSDFESAKDIYKKYLNYPSLDFLYRFMTVIAVKIFVHKIILHLFSFKILKLMYVKKNFFFKILYPGLFPVFRKKIPDYCMYKMSTHCFMAGIYQLKREKKNILVRQKKALYYSSKLKEVNKNLIYLFFTNNFIHNSFIEYPIFLKKNTVLNLHKKFLEFNIDLRFKWYMDNSRFKKFNPNKIYYPNSSLCENNVLCLPLHNKISKSDIDHIVEKFKELIKQ
jgi:dTDP-4-amino-4,6-dideoxygalactose transaminase